MRKWGLPVLEGQELFVPIRCWLNEPAQGAYPPESIMDNFQLPSDQRKSGDRSRGDLQWHPNHGLLWVGAQTSPSIGAGGAMRQERMHGAMATTCFRGKRP